MSTNNRFTILQERKLNQLISSSTITLCPSMDLIVYGIIKKRKQKQQQILNTNGSDDDHDDHDDDNVITGFIIQRTLSWQRLVYITIESVPSSSEKEKEKKGSKNANDKKDVLSFMNSICWSPDGRYLAIGLNNGLVNIYSVDECCTTGNAIPLYTTSSSLLIYDKEQEEGKKQDTTVVSPVVTRSVALRRRLQQKDHKKEEKIGSSSSMYLVVPNKQEEEKKK